jgi:transcription termination/antitermination protein NusA
MSSELVEALEMLAKEKNIEKDYLLERLEQSLAKSYKRVLNLDWDCEVLIDPETGQIFVTEMIGDGEYDEETGEYENYIEHDVTPTNASRIAALNAKGVINSIVNEAARRTIYKEFISRKGEIVTGTVLQVTNDFTIIKIRENVEAELPHFDLKRYPNERNEKPANEYYTHNQRIRALIVDVRDPDKIDTNASKNEKSRQSIVVSRTHPDLIRRLFEIEVPEIDDGVVEIVSVAREPGARSKIAVRALERNLDPVGACVGPKGSRVRMVVGELRGERVDVIQYDENPERFVANALSPAKVTSVTIDPENGDAIVVVPNDQLSLAIGKEGQNARLAARLTGRRIDIKAGGTSLYEQVKKEEEALELDSFIDEEPDGQCEHITASGNRCRNHARPGSRFCGVHAGDEE